MVELRINVLKALMLTANKAKKRGGHKVWALQRSKGKRQNITSKLAQLAKIDSVPINSLTIKRGFLANQWRRRGRRKSLLGQLLLFVNSFPYLLVHTQLHTTQIKYVWNCSFTHTQTFISWISCFYVHASIYVD